MKRRIDPLTVLFLLLLAGCTGNHTPEVSDARIRELIPGQDRTAAYMDIHNPGKAPLVLTGAEAQGVRAIEMHTTSRDGDIMRMRRLQEVVIPPGGTIRFQPGGHHLMLFGVRSVAGQTDIRLTFADGSSRTVVFRRIPIGGG